MFKIVRFPKKLESFFDSLKNQFHWDHFQYFRTLVLLMTISWGRKNITALYRHLDSQNQPRRSRFNNFLNVGRWQPHTVLQMKASEMLAGLAAGKGKPAARLSTADLQNEVRRIVWNDLSGHLKRFSSGTQIIKELERLLMAA